MIKKKIKSGQSGLNGLTIYQNSPIQSIIVINGPKGFKLVQHFLNGKKLSILVRDGQKWHSVVQNGQKCSKGIQYSPKRSNHCQK